MEQKQWLYGRTLGELKEIVSREEMPAFTAGQIARWLYGKNVSQIGQMSDISVKNRERLSQRYSVGGFDPARETVSADGTRKYLFPTMSGGYIESAYIPDRERATLCVSSQAGCRMGCVFCMTGKQGLQHNLAAGEILNQLKSLPVYDTVTNMVYMGMGEPLDNTDQVLRSLEILTAPWGYGWSPTRITLSTAGVLPGMKSFLDHSSVHLAVSLHNPFHEERAELMPVEKAWPVEEVIKLLKTYDFSHQRRVSFEYIILKGINDTPRHIRGLSRLLSGLTCRINIIRFHHIPGSPFFSPPQEEVLKFRDALTAKGIFTTIRASRGEDIEAACGLLTTLEKPGASSETAKPSV